MNEFLNLLDFTFISKLLLLVLILLQYTFGKLTCIIPKP